MAKFTMEVKVGILVSLGLLILAAMIVYFGQFDRHFEEKRGYEIKAFFGFTGGVREGAPVNLAGVEVGRVRQIAISYGPPPMVQLHLWLRPGVRLTQGAKAIISSANILGDRYVEILPGFKDGEVLVAGDVIRGRDPVRLEELARVGEEVALGLREVVESIRRMVGDEKSEEALRQTIRSTQVIAKDLEGLTADLSQVVAENREDITAVIRNFRELSETLKVFTGESREDVDVAIRNFRELSETLKIFVEEIEERPTLFLRGRGRRERAAREREREKRRENGQGEN
ncbi:MlaD family protein [candidate division NPL-UPA2 bacterium]|nr:MlaD family protein [candidate division NPL-UPA2 bacterium]